MLTANQSFHSVNNVQQHYLDPGEVYTSGKFTGM
uniref:Uncharacterized protein n=1 Tax=Arundo donax TaxID=35708 RepID=A0A0A9A0P4_ARUDO